MLTVARLNKPCNTENCRPGLSGPNHQKDPLFLFESDRPHDFRPDLVPTILAWIATVPADQWQYFRGFGAGPMGSFSAEFAMQPTRGGPPRKVSVKFDHDVHTLSNDIGIWTAEYVVPFDRSHLQSVVDTF